MSSMGFLLLSAHVAFCAKHEPGMQFFIDTSECSEPTDHLTRRSHAPLGLQVGKHFGRVSEANASLPAIIDHGLENLINLEQGNPVDPEHAWVDTCFSDLARMYDAMRKSGYPSMITALRDPQSGIEFRNQLCAAAQAGRSAGRSDDCIAVAKHIRLWPQLEDAPRLGWSSDVCANLLATESMEMADPELRQQLRDNITDAPHDEIFRGMYEGYDFPRDPANPLEGFGRSELFINHLRTIFIGPSTVFSKRSGGSRGKAPKNGMFSFNIQSVAYSAMILRFVLRSSGPWYRITNEAVDTRYNYDIFYLEVLNMLEDPLLAEEVRELLAHLNRIIFPHAHPHVRRIRPQGSSMRRKLAHAREVRRARAAAAAAGG
ncbi:hypothetical protein FRC08_006872 [Ceratobasidium sp. 394]|nr:hypothetical protein FRC08_006872 [Ceratobasidium sp. 394]